MSERRFYILTTNTNLAEKKIIIEFNLELEESTISFDTISLINKATNSIEFFEPEVDGKLVILHLREWIEPGSKYIIIVHKGIENIVGDILENPMMRTLEFEEEVISNIEITAPADFEKISDIRIEWNETGETLENRYYVEIAKENAFYNFITKTIVSSKQDILLEDIENGQYFVRIRAERDAGVYGRWSPIKTFIVDNSIKDKADSEIKDDILEKEIESDVDDEFGPIIIEEVKPLEIDEEPVSGETPPSFLFSFSEDIDISEAVITVYRKDFD